MIFINRLICIAIIGFIIGIIIGLYFNSVAFYLLYVFLCFIILIYKYDKRILACIILSVIAICYIRILENSFASTKEGDIAEKAVIISSYTEKGNNIIYNAKILKNNKKVIIRVNKKNLKNTLHFGDLIYINGKLEKGKTARNYKGFDYNLYLKTNKIYGIINVSNIKLIKNNYKFSLIFEIQEHIKNGIYKKINKDEANLLIALLIGDKKELNEDIKTDFSDSNLSHILAVSGTHVSYVILMFSYIIEKIPIEKNKQKIICIVLLLLFMSITNYTPSVMRAVIMGILTILSSILHRKSDVYINLSISSFIILVLNPYTLFDIGFQLSFARYNRNNNIYEKV